jgi:hypothetical protein
MHTYKEFQQILCILKKQTRNNQPPTLHSTPFYSLYPEIFSLLSDHGKAGNKGRKEDEAEKKEREREKKNRKNEKKKEGKRFFFQRIQTLGKAIGKEREKNNGFEILVFRAGRNERNFHSPTPFYFFWNFFYAVTYERVKQSSMRLLVEYDHQAFVPDSAQNSNGRIGKA